MAFIGEAIVSTLVEDLTTLAVEELKQEVRLVVGVEAQVEKLSTNLLSIQTVLADAEQKQLKDAHIRLWLDHLKEISYEMDDVLDEWRSSMLLKARDHAHPSTPSGHAIRKVCSFITSCCFCHGEIGLRRDIAHKIKDINERLNEIVNRRKNFDLTANVGGSTISEQVHGGRSTISDVNILNVYGRAKDEKKIINLLLGKSSNTTLVPQIISIVGMGGLGKTTLAQLAYNNATVKQHFETKIWLCVSDPFDEIKIAKEILESLGGSAGLQLQKMVQEIKEKTTGKKFLVVLDDVWNEDSDKWEKVKAAFVCGLPGSSILITTRNENVAKIMGCKEDNLHRLGFLSTKKCWSIISKTVVSSGMPVEELEQLEDIGRRIADKCKGLPLAAKALGGLLHSKVSRQEWQSILDSEMWELGVDEAEIEKRLFAPLWLSYHDLSPAERQCLSFCTIFPKDSEFVGSLLILLWAAQGYVKDTKSKEMKMVGQQYIRNLSTRSFFQDFEKDENGLVVRFKMHDIVHDFVQFFSKKECLFLEDGATKDESLGSLQKSVRHLLFYGKGERLPNYIFCFEKLRTLFVSSVNELDLDIRRLVNKLSCLRSLIFELCDMKEIPSAIGILVHLRLLLLLNNRNLRELPETVGDLCNLLILKIEGCVQLKKLPRGIGKLSNLRDLSYDGEVRLTQGIGRLNALRGSPIWFRVDECADENGEVASLGNLNNMNNLHSVVISLLRNVKHVDGAKRAQLNEKKHLVYLRIFFLEEEEEAEKYDGEVIEALRPCSNLEELQISHYQGNYNPSWLLSLTNLRKVNFFDWKNCKCLPPLGMLPSLTTLELYGMKGIKKVGLEFMGIEIKKEVKSLSAVVFPKLKTLEFWWFTEWEEWEMDGWGDFTIMPNLTHLTVRGCQKLKALPHHLVQKPTLNLLNITGSDLIVERYKKHQGVDWDRVSHISNFYY